MDFSNPTIKKYLVRITGLVVLLWAVWWVSGQGYVKVRVDGSASGEVSYGFVQQNVKKGSSVKSSSGTVKKLLHRGTYEVLVTQNNKSFFALVRSGGFFGTKTINGTLAVEKSRTFVGDNPSSCMTYLETKLISYSCGDLAINIATHFPAVGKQSTYTQTNGTNGVPYAYVSGIVRTGEGTLALARIPVVAGSIASQTIYRLGDSSALTDGTRLEQLDAVTPYGIKANGRGFIVYNTSYNSIYRFDSSRVTGVHIVTDGPRTKDLLPFSIDAQGETIATTYATSQENKEPRTEVVISRGGKSMHFVFNQHFTTVVLCGTQKLCALSKDGVSIYGITKETKTPKPLYKISGVATIQQVDAGLLVFRLGSVLLFDVEKQSGYQVYSLGGYSLVSVQPAANGFLLGVSDYRHKKEALLVDLRSIDVSSIDKKVFELEKLPQIKDLTIYDKSILYSSAVPIVYDQAQHSFVYDPKALDGIQQIVDKRFKELGVDSSYTITNTSR